MKHGKHNQRVGPYTKVNREWKMPSDSAPNITKDHRVSLRRGRRTRNSVIHLTYEFVCETYSFRHTMQQPLRIPLSQRAGKRRVTSLHKAQPGCRFYLIPRHNIIRKGIIIHHPTIEFRSLLIGKRKGFSISTDARPYLLNKREPFVNIKLINAQTFD
jgi:hypothetical protein